MNTQSSTQAPEPDDSSPDTWVLPGSPRPLSPGRVTVNPDREPGVDELPDQEGNQPHPDDDEGAADRIDVDLDNAEFDDQPNPR